MTLSGRFLSRRALSLSLLACSALSVFPASAGRVRVAVAANFTAAAQELCARFDAATGHECALSFGSTGQLYTQIEHGAPFDVFLAADQTRPAAAITAGLGVRGTQLTYATGRIVLYSAEPDRVSDASTLDAADFDKLAIANPRTAPYGAAAVQVMTALGVLERLRPKLVEGTNIAQAFQFVATGNAELGFVALAQIAGTDVGSRWVVPQDLYDPIRQDGVLLQSGAKKPAAKAFMTFLHGADARAVVRRHGYVVDE